MLKILGTPQDDLEVKVATTFFGGGEDDLVLAGYSDFDLDQAALLDIQREWTRNASNIPSEWKQ